MQDSSAGPCCKGDLAKPCACKEGEDEDKEEEDEEVRFSQG